MQLSMVCMPVSPALENWRQEDHGSKSACLPHLITYVVCVFHLIRVISLSTLSHVHTLLTIGRARSRQWAVGSVLQVHTAVYPVYTGTGAHRSVSSVHRDVCIPQCMCPVYTGTGAHPSVCIQCTQGQAGVPVPLHTLAHEVSLFSCRS